MIVFGGVGAGTEVWALSLAEPAWSQLAVSGTPPAARSGHAAAYSWEVPIPRMIVFGGYSGTGLDEVWALSLAPVPTWTRLTPAGAPPSARWGHAAVYDPVRDRMIVLGGRNTTYLGDAWALSLSGTPTSPRERSPPPRPVSGPAATLSHN